MKPQHNLRKNETPRYQLNNSSTDDKACLLKFSMCDDKYPMYNLNSDEIKEFIKFAKKVENMEWKDIKRDKGLRYEVLENFDKPNNISKDVVIRSMRLSKKSRIIGYRESEFFYIVWFDNKHATC